MRIILFIPAFIFILFTGSIAAQEHLNYPALTNACYTQNGFAFTKPGMASASLRRQLIALADSSVYKGLDATRYHADALHAFTPYTTVTDSAALVAAEKYFTDAAISYCKALVAPPATEKWLSYNELSGKTAKKEEEQLLAALAAVKDEAGLQKMVAAIEPQTTVYTALTTELGRQQQLYNTANIEKLKTTLAYYRWIYHFRFEKCIVVNIAAAGLQYFERNDVKLEMKVIVGKPSTRTPRFAAYCNQVVLYPYWHVPRSIAVNEILPSCKKSPGAIARLRLQVLDRNGRIVSPGSINWKQYNKSNMPFTFRQTTGCDNALGVMKFNLTSPYSVYLHDTNLKSAFASARRYLSHGCIRIEKPVELANYICPNGIDTNLLNACIKGQESKTLPVSPVPVFVVYMPVTVSGNGEVMYLEDIYKLLR